MNSERLRNTQIGLEDFSGSLAPSPVIEREKSKEPLYKTLSAPISAQVEVTEVCNLSCVHCYNVWHQKPPSEYSTLNKDRLLYVLEELRDSGVFKVTLTGGEPLLSKDSVIEAVQYLADEVNNYYRNFFNPYLNFHRPCGFPTITFDEKGKRHKVYQTYQVPYEALKGITRANRFLKPGITFEKLDIIAYQYSDNQWAEIMRNEERKLFEIIMTTDHQDGLRRRF